MEKNNPFDVDDERFEEDVRSAALLNRQVIPNNVSDSIFYQLAKIDRINIKKFAYTNPAAYSSLNYPSSIVPNRNTQINIPSPDLIKSDLMKTVAKPIMAIKNLVVPAYLNIADKISRPGYATMGIISDMMKGDIDDIPDHVYEEVLSGLGKNRGRKLSFYDILGQAGWKPKTKYEKAAKFAIGLAGDIIIDPLWGMKLFQTPKAFRNLLFLAKKNGIDNYIHLGQFVEQRISGAIKLGESADVLNNLHKIKNLVKHNIELGYTIIEPVTSLSSRAKIGAFATAQFLDIPIFPRRVDAFISAKLESIGSGLSNMPIIKPTAEWMQRKFVYGSGNKVADNILGRIQDQTDYEVMKEIVVLRQKLGKLMPNKFSIFKAGEAITKDDWHVMLLALDPVRHPDAPGSKKILNYLHGIWNSMPDDRKNTLNDIVTHLNKMREKYTEIDFDSKTYESLLGLGGPGGFRAAYFPHIPSPMFKEALSEINSRLAVAKDARGKDILSLIESNFGTRSINDLSILEINQLEKIAGIKIEEVLTPSRIETISNRFPGGGKWFVEDPIEATVVRFYKSIKNKNTAFGFEELVKHGRLTGVRKISFNNSNELRTILMKETDKAVYMPAGTFYKRLGKKGIDVADLDFDGNGWVQLHASDLDDLIKGPVLKRLDEAYIMPKGVANFLNSNMLNSNPKGLTHLLEQATSLWKAHTLLLFAGYHTRNFLSNIMLTFRMGLTNPLYFSRASSLQMALWAERRNLPVDTLGKHFGHAVSTLSDFKIKTATGDIIDGYNLLEELGKRGVLGTGYYGVEFPGTAALKIYDGMPAGYAYSGSKEFVNSLLGYEGPLLQTGARIGEALENNARLALSIWAVEKGYDFDEVARLVRFTLFRFDKLTPFEKKLRSRYIPFYAFERFNLEFQLKTHVMQPGRASMIYKAVLRAQENGKEPDGIFPSGVPDSLIYNHIKNNFNIPIKRVGNKVYYALLKTWVPEASLYEWMDTKNTKNKVFNMLNPFIKLPVELFVAGDRFSDERLAASTTALKGTSLLKKPFLSMLFPSRTGWSFFSNDKIQEMPYATGQFLGMEMSKRAIQVFRNVRWATTINEIMEDHAKKGGFFGFILNPNWVFGNLSKVDEDKALQWKMAMLNKEMTNIKSQLKKRMFSNTASDEQIKTIADTYLEYHKILYGEEAGIYLYSKSVSKMQDNNDKEVLLENLQDIFMSNNTDPSKTEMLKSAAKRAWGKRNFDAVMKRMNKQAGAIAQ